MFDRWHRPKNDANTYLTRVQPARTRKTHLHPQPSGRVGLENACKSCFLICTSPSLIKKRQPTRMW